MPLSDIIMAKKLFGEGGSGGPTVVKEKDVNFYDYDGTLVASYTKAEAQALTELPAAPDHSGDDIPLTFQSWNYTLAQVNAITLALDVGATYISADGKTHILIDCNGYTGNPTISINKSDTSELTIDWGGNIASGNRIVKTTASGIQTINCDGYSIYGKYHISMWISSGSGTYVLGYNANTKNFVGQTTEGSRSMVTKVVIGANVTGINSYAFYLARSLETLILPNNVVSLSDYWMNSCYKLKTLIIPSSITSIPSNSFYKNFSLEKIVIPESVTNIVGYSFYQNYGLEKVVIPKNITSIGDNVFYQCYAMSNYYCLMSTPPTLGGTSSFTNILATCLIHVQSASASAYRSATNWATYQNYIRGE